MDARKIAEAGPRRLLPLTERRQLGRGDVLSGHCVEIVASSREPLDERAASRLARRRRREEELLQHGVSFEGRIAEVPGRLGFSKCMMSSPPRATVPAESSDGCSRGGQVHLLHNPSAERESSASAARDARRPSRKCQGMRCHSGYRGRHLAG